MGRGMKKPCLPLFVCAMMMMTACQQNNAKTVMLSSHEQRMYAYIQDVYMGKTHQPALTPQAETFAFGGVENVRMHAVLTGEYAPSRTRSRFNIAGTDLGIPVVLDDGTTLYIFGDSFEDDRMDGRWLSNFIAKSSTVDPADGIFFDAVWAGAENGFVTRGSAEAVIPGAHHARNQHGDWEVTIIPTGGVVVNGDIYVFYMSVEWWGPPGVWAAGHGSMAVSRDGGVTWENLYDTIHWQGDTYHDRPNHDKDKPAAVSSGFEQSHPVDGRDGYIYFFGIPGGRMSPAKLMRVSYENIERQAMYEFLVGYAVDNSPIWWSYADGGLSEAIVVLDGTIGEMSVMYSDYLEEWLITTISYDDDWDIMIRSAKTLWGDYSASQQLVSFEIFPTLYGAFLVPTFQAADSANIYFVMSLWGIPPTFADDDLLYNSFLMEAALLKNGRE